MIILQPMEEEALKIILKKYDGNEKNFIPCGPENFPQYMRNSFNDVFTKLKYSGVIASFKNNIHFFWIYLTPAGITYFQDKEAYLKQKSEEEKKSKSQNIITINADRSNVVVGDITNSTLSIDNSIHEIEKMIDENGGVDKEDLKEILDEVKDILENINDTRRIPRNKNLLQRISDHAAKHGWFYGAIVQLLGTGALTVLGN